MSADTEFFDAVTELSERQAEKLRRCGFVVSRLLEGIDDRLTLHADNAEKKAPDKPGLFLVLV